MLKRAIVIASVVGIAMMCGAVPANASVDGNCTGYMSSRWGVNCNGFQVFVENGTDEDINFTKGFGLYTPKDHSYTPTKVIHPHETSSVYLGQECWTDGPDDLILKFTSPRFLDGWHRSIYVRRVEGNLHVSSTLYGPGSSYENVFPQPQEVITAEKTKPIHITFLPLKAPWERD